MPALRATERDIVSERIARDRSIPFIHAAIASDDGHIPHAPIAAASVLRIHSETVLLLALAAASTRFRSAGLKRTGTMLPLATPLGSFGLPGCLFAAFGTVFVPLNDVRLFSGLG